MDGTLNSVKSTAKFEPLRFNIGDVRVKTCRNQPIQKFISIFMANKSSDPISRNIMSYLKKYIALTIFIITSLGTFAQKKVIDHNAFDGWKSLKSEKISNSGKYITYEIAPLKGDTYLYIFNTETGEMDSINRAKNANFSFDEKFLSYTIEAGYDTLRKVELDKVDKKKWPKDSLAIYDLTTKSIQKFAQVKSSSLGENHNWLAFTENENEIKDTPKKKETVELSKKEKAHAEKAKKKAEKSKKSVAEAPKKDKPNKSDGKVLRLVNLNDNSKIAFKNVTNHTIDKKGERMIYATHLNDTMQLHILSLPAFEHKTIEGVFKGIEQIVIDSTKQQMVFLGSNDTTKTKVFTLYHYNFETNALTTIIDTTTAEIPTQWTVVKNNAPRFSPNGDRLFFGVYDRPTPEKKDTLTDAEKPKLDLWTYNEPVLQTQQIVALKREGSKAYTYAYDFDSKKIIELENDTLNIQRNFYEQTDYALSTSKRPYETSYMWDISGKQDFYRTNLKTGEKQLIKRGVTSAIDLSRKADKFVYFNHENGQYYAIDINTKKEICLTCTEKGKNWSSDNNGMPMEHYAVGHFGWNKEGTQVFLAEQNDFYTFDFNSNSLINLTKSIGSNNKIEFSPKQWHRDSTFAEINNFYLVGLDKITKGSHLYFFENGELIKKGYWDAKLVNVTKAKNANVFTLRKQTVTEYPDLHFWKENIATIKQISTTNPQQSDYNWATVELINWKTYNGLDLEGLVYKPENFDANKSYPLLVYFYELYSDDLHNHYAPRPTASIIFPTEYASGDYIVFIPDIRYKPGYPARGAYDCIMSGTDAVLKKYKNIDSTRMGLQGQSWGGYQTAQLITMTTRYKAAMAGAPVGNMFSAFGGIRWGTGMSRQFQYEKTQSRIGATMWEKPELYIENSPVFHLPKVKTPLMIMHNDEDGAVPWYQGIELFTGLRRLGKPAWLLNYNGDDHNLMKPANRRDLSIRMRQFFDHYLHNQPAPKWMTDGIPANRKGKELRYELD